LYADLQGPEVLLTPPYHSIWLVCLLVLRLVNEPQTKACGYSRLVQKMNASRLFVHA
jgi:hypothetical protein